MSGQGRCPDCSLWPLKQLEVIQRGGAGVSYLSSIFKSRFSKAAGGGGMCQRGGGWSKEARPWVVHTCSVSSVNMDWVL